MTLMTFLLRWVLPPEKWKSRMNKYQDSEQKSMQQEKVILQNCWYVSIFRFSLISLSNGSIIKSCQQSLNSIKRTTGHLGNQGVGQVVHAREDHTNCPIQHQKVSSEKNTYT